MIYLVAFVSGAVLMGLEMVGSRILAPFFGSSIFVWGSLIGVVLTALSLGYYVGGKFADKYPGKGPLSIVISLAGAWISLVLLLSRSALPAIASSYSGSMGPVLASFTLFFVPGSLLAMVSPWCIRLSISSVEASGGTSGVLYAVSNVGSILGTFVTSFYLIPKASVDAITRGMSFALILLAAFMVLAVERKRVCAAVLAVSLFVAAAINLPVLLSPKDAGLLYETQSLYHHIYVVEKGRQRLLKFDNSIQGGMYVDDPFTSCFPYADYFHLSLCFKKDIRDVLMIGLGAGLVPKRFWNDYREMRIDVVEIDPKVDEVARKYFGFPQDERLKVYIEDGRMFLRDVEKKYDLIMVDAYYADSIPFHLTTQEFYQLVRSRLKPGGVVAYNMIGAVAGPKSKLFRSMHLTFSRVFPVNYVFPLEYSQGNEEYYRNILVFGVEQGGNGQKLGSLPLGRDEIAAIAEELAGTKVTIKGFATFTRDLYQKTPNYQDAVLLTDKYAPIDSLLYLY